MKTGLLILSLLLLNSIVIGQQPMPWCGTNYYLEKEFAKNPGAKAEFEKQYAKMGLYINKRSIQAEKAKVKHIIPVVVHVIHDNGNGNITKAQVEDGITVLNEDYARMNADTSQTRALFKPYAANPEFEFRLAKIDPSGNCTEGIVRVNSPLTNNANDDVKYTSNGGSSAWPTNKYLNIWLVNTIEGSGTGITLGYAYYPNWAGGNVYGALIRNDYFGRIGTSSSDGRTATHEVGHNLGLAHTFDDGCGSNCSSSGDYICDTPPAANDTYGCSSSQNTCSNDQGTGSPYTSDVVDQIENYMGYDDCQNMFTTGQKTEMKYSIANYTQLSNFVSASNLQATGTNDGYAADTCVPISDFLANNRVICTGQSIEFSDISYNGTIDGRQWTFSGGVASSTTDSSVLVTYNSPGTYTVSLSVYNSAGSNLETKTSYITVLSSGLKTMPYSEGFENTSVPGTDWTIVNDDGGKTWDLSSTVSYSGTKCIRMNNYNNSSGQTDEIISPTIDLSVLDSNVQVNFKAAYAQRTSTSSDVLRVYVSGDCGFTWELRYVKSGALLASVPIQNSTFTPTDTSLWKSWSFLLFTQHLTGNFRYKFRFVSGSGNYLYIDNINITGSYNAVPLLISPVNYSIDIPIESTLDWNAVNGVDSYEVQIDTLLAFNSPFLSDAKKVYVASANNGTDTEHNLAGLDSGIYYFWRVRTITGSTSSVWSVAWRFKTKDKLTGIMEEMQDVSAISIFPNPLSHSSVVSFSLKNASEATIEIVDIFGRRSSILENQLLPPGQHTIQLSSIEIRGIYLIKITLPDSTFAQRIMVQ